ncbi:PQQ enzyme repeat domain protein [Myxococcus xanthus DK 1622]|uniref:PQQ enzyme repeat domain protein n=2 Tax=Myxococcus xanthus TaxID=34 RepID=Q1D609_MYXXD|nr:MULTISPECIES: PQQ-binding-like beta-propeller repeat protein [Myxococcus]ABF89786.1 PQQ enzyme repeat domain protein [Myxococcus xanthus DK 1622]NOJ58182.1 PQQ-binding-like beta-propeller repeat protein [Myxococcus xanthus]QPM83121.1 PQQ-like beta-propeller repeat protein [Myxococcus xanthus]QVW65427.1 PQQ-like beta-propeller repeat protein [Myxococcus xanthus DZ2]QZZ51421.1 Outer membrane protein assembly factor BamB [Myxococcus xanthus]
MRPFSAPLVAAVALLAPSLGWAQSMTPTAVLTTQPQGGDTRARVVMDEASELTVDVRNNTSSGSPLFRRINEVWFALPSGYIPLASIPPPGWTVDYIASERWVIFYNQDSCNGSGDYGLGQDESARFVLRVVPPTSNNDQNNERFVASQTFARDTCAGGDFTTSVATSAASWSRSGLYTQVDVRPRVMGVGGDIDARMVVENRTGTNHNNTTVEGPSTGAGAVTFQVVDTEPTPFRMNIANRNAGVYSARVRTGSAGTLVARVRGVSGNGNTVSPSMDARMVNVGALPVAMDVDTDDAFNNETVRVRLTVTNPSSTDTFLNVTPRAPVFQGTAAVSLVSGPGPASVPRLDPGASAHFVWTYQLTGTPFANYRFRGQVDATRNGASVTSNLVDSNQGRIVQHRVRTNISALAANSTNRSVIYTIQNRGPMPLHEVRLLRPALNYFTVGGVLQTPTGWRMASNNATTGITWESTNATGIPVNGERSFTVVYSNFGAGASLSGPTTFRHRFHLIDDYGGPQIRIETPMTLAQGTVPDVNRLTGVARDGSVTLTWDNPAVHGGVLILRAEGAPPNLSPTQGLNYAVGAYLGNAQVVYADDVGAATTFTDTSVTNGTTYYYRVFNSDDLRWYSPGNQPTSQALVATPRARVGAAPLWCYSVGLNASQQPITELGTGIFSAFNDSVVANLTQVTNPSADGAERWRPRPLAGLIGSRFPVVPLHGLSGQYILVGDQGGVASALNAATGQVLWRWDNGGQPIGTIQSFPVTQLFDYANAAYRAAHPNRDLVFFATRLADASRNRVVALNAATGALVWSYQPGNLGMVAGGMVVDYTNNRLFVATRAHAGSPNTLRVLNTLTGQVLAQLPVGDVELSLVRNAYSNLILVTDSDGFVHGVDAATAQLVWSLPVTTRPAPNTPAFTSFVRPQGSGFVASLAAGRVALYDVSGPAQSPPVLRWSTPIASPSGTFSFNRNGAVRIYVGSSDGQVHQLELLDGSDSGQVSIGGAQRIGTPTIDHTVSRLHVGSEDGRICAFPVPFP